MEPIPVRAANGDVVLAGTIWTTGDVAPRGLVAMYPGSGPSDRNNDVLFPPIRAALLAIGMAVCSFDKRGVGESTGNWLEAGIEDQAEDLAVSLRAARSLVPDGAIGLFGHSQGGWVVLEAARPTGADFVITNSGPAVSPRVQETFATAHILRDEGWPDAQVRDGMTVFDEIMDRAGSGQSFAIAQGWMQEPVRRDLIAALLATDVLVPDTDALWSFVASIVDHDPREALEHLDVPLLALLGDADVIVPVERSAAVYRDFVRPDLLDLRILTEGNHRLQPVSRDGFVPGYLDTISSFVAAQLE